MKRERDATFNDVDWKHLFSKYDVDNNGLIDMAEFTFLIKDAMSLRDNNTVSLEDATATTRVMLSSMPNQFIDGMTVKELQQCVESGLFDASQLDVSLLITLCHGISHEDRSSMPLPLHKCTSSSAEELSTRPLVSSALKKSSFGAQYSTKTQPAHSEEAQLDNIHEKCIICFDMFPRTKLWGTGVFYKRCQCDIIVCLSCLRDSAIAQIADAQRPTCPHMLSVHPPMRCTVPLDPSLVAQLLKGKCSLCVISSQGSSELHRCGDPDTTGPESGEGGETRRLVSSSCSLDAYHKFCVPCLSHYICKALTNCGTRGCLPKCPRSAECRSDLTEGAVRRVLSAAGKDADECEEWLEKWHLLRLANAHAAWRWVGNAWKGDI